MTLRLFNWKNRNVARRTLRYKSMSRLRRPYISGEIFFVTCNLRRMQKQMGDAEFTLLAAAMDRVPRRRGFLIPGYVFMPDHWHALIVPADTDSLPRVMNSLKVASSHDINRVRQRQGSFWQLRYYDRALRTVKEFRDSLQYMHMNPVSKGLVSKPEDWSWSSIRAYGGPGLGRLRIDVVDLPADEKARLL